jgi:plasmid maintenance system antidote protein VapI
MIKLIDEIKRRNGIWSDNQLAKLLKISPAHMSNIRHKRKGLNDILILRIYDNTDLTIEEIRNLASKG